MFVFLIAQKQTEFLLHKLKDNVTVARLLAQSMTETEIAIRLDVQVSTSCRDIKALKAKSQQFVYDLAKSDLAYYYN